ncbi:MAG: efflux RND transporter periplasmic adaptor subunit [Phycisphaerae bacterium]|nr:efflux RND transporter periplasmic adaptor subunit [Phycisphaerae bacterium]
MRRLCLLLLLMSSSVGLADIRYDYTYDVFNQDKMVGHYYINGIVDEKIIAVGENIKIKFNENDLSLQSNVSYDLENDKLLYGVALTKINGKLAMVGNILVDSDKLVISATGYLDKNGNKLPEANYGKAKNYSEPLQNKYHYLTYSGIEILGQKLTEGGPKADVAIIEFPDDLSMPEIVTIKYDYQLERKANDDGSYEVVLKDKAKTIVHSWGYEKDGKFSDSQQLHSMELKNAELNRYVKIETELSQERKEIIYPATVQANPAVELSFSSYGVIAKLPYKKGAFIPAGQVIAEQENQRIRSLLSDAARVRQEALMYLQQLQYRERTRKNVLSKDMAEANSAFSRADNRYTNLEKALAASTVTAPFDSVITEINIDNGEFAAVGQTVVTVQNNSYITIATQISAKDIVTMDYIKRQKFFKVTFDVLGDRKFDLVFDQLEPVIGNEQISQINFAMARVQGLNILPGLNCKIHYTLPVNKPVVTVPAKAVLSDSQGQYVWRISDDGLNLIKQKITVSITIDDYCIVDSGIGAGQKVAVSQLDQLFEGRKFQEKVKN